MGITYFAEPKHSPGNTSYTPLVEGVYCPIDNTQLLDVDEYDFSNYMCPTCGATYIRGDTNPNSLLEQAKWYIGRIGSQVASKKDEIARLEKIIELAREKKFI